MGGTITNNGNPVEDAKIELVLTTTNATYKTNTRKGRGYEIFNVQAGGPYTVSITAGRGKTVTIDGANFNNNIGLSSNNLPGGNAQPISLDAIEAVQVNVSPFDLRQSNFTGAAITYNSGVRNAIVLSNTNQGKGFSASFTLKKDFHNGLDLFVSYSYNNTMDITANPGSQAASAWSGNAIIGTALGQNQNTPYLAQSQYATPHRLVGAISYTKEYAKNFATTVTLSYEGFNAGRFNYIYSSDVNNDGIGNNDLIFIHKSSDIQFKEYTAGGVTYTAEDQAKAWDAYVEQDAYLSKNVGNFADRYAALFPWLHRFNLAIYQDVFKKIGSTNHKLQLSANILNVGNLINANWGIAQRLTVNNGAVLKANTDGTYQFNTAGGQLPTTTFTDVTSTSTTWGAQIGVRYLF